MTVDVSDRRTTLDVPVTQPMIRALPAIYQDGAFLERFTAGLDAVLAPVLATLDCLHAYVDPHSAPDDFVAWLGAWVGVDIGEDWTSTRSRRLVAAAADLFARRGTASGLSDEIRLYTGGRASIGDPGQVWTSSVPTSDDVRAQRRNADRSVRVVVDVADAASVNWPALQELVRAAVPAHLPVAIELRHAGGLPAPTVDSSPAQQGADPG